jgi:general nucleoside transport system permease protein
MSTAAPPQPEPPVEESPPGPEHRSRLGKMVDGVRYGNAVVVTFLALLVAVVVGGLLIAVADDPTRQAASYFFSYPWDTFSRAWDAISGAYGALLQGAILDPATLSSGDPSKIFNPLSETVLNSIPLILAGLSVGLAFRAGLFNIGAQGQIILGAMFAGYVGFAWHLPVVLHLLVALVAGVLGGAIWGGIAGVLKARTGAHEVITTIMLNYIAVYLLAYLLSVRGFQRAPYQQAISRVVDDNATLPQLFGSNLRVHAGIIIALLAAVGVGWLLDRSTIGFQLRAVGANPNAARTAGMSVERNYILVMVLAGALAGLAGCSQILGTNPAITQDIDGGFGFDGITVALLGRGRPGGTVLAGLLFGALRAGGVQMQSTTGTPIDLVVVIQSLIVLFIAAPPLIRAIFRLKATRGAGVGGTALAKGWNG